MNETSIKNIKLIHPMKSNDTNSYNLTSFEIIHQNDAANFGIRIKFERNDRGINGVLINYHLSIGQSGVKFMVYHYVCQ